MCKQIVKIRRFNLPFGPIWSIISVLSRYLKPSYGLICRASLVKLGRDKPENFAVTHARVSHERRDPKMLKCNSKIYYEFYFALSHLDNNLSV